MSRKQPLFPDFPVNGEWYEMVRSIDRRVHHETNGYTDHSFLFCYDDLDNHDESDAFRREACSEWRLLTSRWGDLFSAMENVINEGIHGWDEQKIDNLILDSNRWADRYLGVRDVAALKNSARQRVYRQCNKKRRIPEKISINKEIRDSLLKLSHSEDCDPGAFVRLAVMYCIYHDDVRRYLVKQIK